MLQEGHKKIISAVALNPDGTLLASADWDKNVFIWDASSGNIIRKYSTSTICHSLYFHIYKPILAACDEGTLRFFKYNEKMVEFKDSDVGSVLHVTISPDLNWLVSFQSENSSVVKGKIGNPNCHNYKLNFWGLKNCKIVRSSKIGQFMGY